MRIVHLRSTNFYGGPERQIHQHARRLKEHGWEVVVASFAEDGQTPEMLKVVARDGIPVHTVAVKSAYDWRAASLIRTYLKENRVDLLCTHDYRSHLLGHLAVRGADARHVCFARGFTKDNFKVRLYQWLDRRTLRYANHVVAVSRHQIEELAALRVDRARLSWVGNAVDPEALAQLKRTHLRAQFGLPANSLIVAAAGRFSREKGQRFLLPIARKICHADDHVCFVLFGDGPDLVGVKKTIAAWQLTDRILCPGFEPNLVSALKDVDLLVNPSQSEGMPNIVLEAMAIGVPVIATAVGGVPELIDHGRSGLLVDYGNEAAMFDAISSLIEDYARRGILAANALVTVKEDFSFDAQTDRLMAIYREVPA